MKNMLHLNLLEFNWAGRPGMMQRFLNLFIAPGDNAPPKKCFRLWIFPLVFIPWLLLYEFVVYRGPAPRTFSTYLPGELGWPIWQPMEVFYDSAYLLVTLAPFVAPTNAALRRFAISGLLSIIIGNMIFLTIPAIALPRPFQPSGWFGWLMVMDRNLDLNNGTAAFPSFHVVWSFLGAVVFIQRWPRLRLVCWTWAVLVSASCILTGMHSLADVVAGFLLFLAINSHPNICNFMKAMFTSRMLKKGVNWSI